MDSSNHFNQVANRWDSNPARVAMAQKHCELIKKSFRLSADMEVLDFGCGTGLVSLCILPYVKKITGVDGSEGMVSVFQEKIKANNIPNCSAVYFHSEQSFLPPGEHSYDLIITTMTFHHIKDIRKVLGEFFSVLKPGGQVCIIDLEKEDGSFHEDPAAGAVHEGFEQQYLYDALYDTGFKKIDVSVGFVHERKSTQKKYPILIAKAAVS